MRPTRLQLGLPVKVLSRGSTQPLNCLLEDEAGVLGDWVVKLPEKRRPMALLAEAVGALVVDLVGVRTPEAGYLVLPSEPLNLGAGDARSRLDDAIAAHRGQRVFCSRLVKSAGGSRTNLPNG